MSTGSTCTPEASQNILFSCFSYCFTSCHINKGQQMSSLYWSCAQDDQKAKMLKCLQTVQLLPNRTDNIWVFLTFLPVSPSITELMIFTKKKKKGKRQEFTTVDNLDFCYINLKQGSHLNKEQTTKSKQKTTPKHKNYSHSWVYMLIWPLKAQKQMYSFSEQEEQIFLGQIIQKSYVYE